MKKQCSIFASFVHPLSEDPWIGPTHLLQYDKFSKDSFKILTQNCYGANSASRILGPDGRIRKIINNFNYMNFSFQPAILSALSRQAPNIYRRIKEADKDSLARWGSGNAVAQPYNYQILPLLDSPERIEHQVRKGLDFFRHHFQRESEGFFLPEGAVSPQVLDILVKQGIKYLILSSNQIQATGHRGSGNWSSPPRLWDSPYQIDRPEGSLSVFLFHQGLYQDMVWGDLLESSQKLHGGILAQMNPEASYLPLFVPGEVLGQEKAFGDMCFASFFDRLENDPELELVNLGNRLIKHPPEQLARLYRGHGEWGVSSTCPHGLSRWTGDCDCAGGHQIQSWKHSLSSYLRELLNRILLSIQTEFATVPGLHEQDLLIQAHWQLLEGLQPPQEFFKTSETAHSLDAEGQSRVLGLLLAKSLLEKALEAPAWGQDSLASAEGQEILAFLLSALEVLDGLWVEDLEYELDSFASSLNLYNCGYTNLKDLLDSRIRPRRKGPEYAAALFLLAHLFPGSGLKEAEELGHYRLLSISGEERDLNTHIHEHFGSIALEQTKLLKSYRLDFHFIEDHMEGVSLHFLNSESPEALPLSLDISTLPDTEKEKIVQIMTKDLEAELVTQSRSLLSKLQKAMTYSRNLGMPAPPAVKDVTEATVIALVHHMQPEEGQQLSSEQLSQLSLLFRFAREHGLNLDEQLLGQKFTLLVSSYLRSIPSYAAPKVIDYLKKIMGLIYQVQLPVDITVPQTLIYEYCQRELSVFLDELHHEKIEGLKKIKDLLRLAKLFNLDFDHLKELVVDVESPP